jgi:hypothetical protein
VEADEREVRVLSPGLCAEGGAIGYDIYGECAGCGAADFCLRQWVDVMCCNADVHVLPYVAYVVLLHNVAIASLLLTCSYFEEVLE